MPLNIIILGDAREYTVNHHQPAVGDTCPDRQLDNPGPVLRLRGAYSGEDEHRFRRNVNT